MVDVDKTRCSTTGEHDAQPSVDKLVPEGFYRVTFDGCPGIGHCRHLDTIGGDDFEGWDLMYLRPTTNGGQSIWNSSINSKMQSYTALIIGKRVRGLPRRHVPHTVSRTPSDTPNTDPYPKTTTADNGGRG